jgi:hypothetical protein
MAVVNAMSVDVEDYYHVSAFEESVERSRWPEFESRVVANTQRLLDLFDEFKVRVIRISYARLRCAATKWRPTDTSTGSSTRSVRRTFAKTCAGRNRNSKT